MSFAITHPSSIDQINAVAVVSVAVPYRKPGNVIGHLLVRFEVFRQGSRFRAVALCSENDKRLTALPDVLLFEAERSRVLCKRADLAAVAQDIAAECNRQRPQATNPFNHRSAGHDTYG